MKQVSVIGAGAWGTALAVSLAKAGNDVTIVAREVEVVESINTRHVNDLFLSGVTLPSSIKAISDLKQIIKSDIIFLVPPAQYLENLCRDLKRSGLSNEIPLVICSKGIKTESGKLMNEILEEILPNQYSILSGPSFAKEVATGLPVHVTLASKTRSLGMEIINSIKSPVFNVDFSDDVISVQIGGAIKNVIAIACGISAGAEMGENHRAALMVKGLQEMRTLCLAKGGKAETIMEMCCVGDLILTCSSRSSRNMSLGYDLGKGKKISEILAERKTVAEGIESAKAINNLAKKLNVSLPICQFVNDILNGSKIYPF